MNWIHFNFLDSLETLINKEGHNNAKKQFFRPEVT